MNNSAKSWDFHYTRSKSVLSYPDENLVRLLSGFLADRDRQRLRAIDTGCGTGRHLKLLSELGIGFSAGLDNSFNALSAIKNDNNQSLVQGDNISLPFRDETFDIAVSWGSLHYCKKDRLMPQIMEIYRIIKPGGVFFGTLRCDRDTYLKRGEHLGDGTWITSLNDLKDQVVSFYNESELKKALGIFKNPEYGLIERTLIGDMNSVISHWIFRAEK